MQTAVSNPCAAPQRDIDTIILEARHLLGTSKPLEPGKTQRVYPKDPVTIAKVLALREESGLGREKFCERVNVGPATFWCWEEGKTGGGKDWPALRALQLAKQNAATMAALSHAAEVSASKSVEWSIPATSPVTDLVGDAAKRLERLRQSPPQVATAKVEAVGVAFSTPQIAPKIVDDRPTAEDLIRPSEKISVSVQFQPDFLKPNGTFDYKRIGTVMHEKIAEELQKSTDNRLRGPELIAARDEAYARFQAATERMPAAEAAADLVSIYRRSHRGLPGFVRSHYDAEMMAKRLEQWTAGRDEEGEQWDRLIGLLTARGIKPSINGLGKRAAKALRVVKPADDAPEMTLIRPARGFLDLDGGFHESETDALTSSWDRLVQRATDEILTQAARANVTLRSFLMSDEATKPTDDLARVLKGREAHQRAIKGDK